MRDCLDVVAAEDRGFVKQQRLSGHRAGSAANDSGAASERVEYRLWPGTRSRRRGARMYEDVDTVVLDNELAYQDVLPVQWMALWEPPDRFDLLRLEGDNLLLLQACVAAEERRERDKNEELGPLAAEIARLDFKLNLVMQLLAKLVSKHRMPPATPLL